MTKQLCRRINQGMMHDPDDVYSKLFFHTSFIPIFNGNDNSIPPFKKAQLNGIIFCVVLAIK